MDCSTMLYYYMCIIVRYTSIQPCMHFWMAECFNIALLKLLLNFDHVDNPGVRSTSRHINRSAISISIVKSTSMVKR